MYFLLGSTFHKETTLFDFVINWMFTKKRNNEKKSSNQQLRSLSSKNDGY